MQRIALLRSVRQAVPAKVADHDHAERLWLRRGFATVSCLALPALLYNLYAAAHPRQQAHFAVTLATCLDRLFQLCQITASRRLLLLSARCPPID